MIKKFLTLTFISVTVLSCNKEGKKVAKLSTEEEKASYAIGLFIATPLKGQGLEKELNTDVLKQAITDKLTGAELLFPEDSIDLFLQTYMPKLQEKISKRNLETGKKFLEENKKKEGVKTTASGLQYKVEKEGEGAKPVDNDMVTVHYVLKSIDGEVIQDSKKVNGNQPTELPLLGVVSGWREGVKLMSKGAKYTLYVPSDLAYGAEGGPAGGNAALIFEVELVDFKPMPEELKQQIQGQQQMQQQMQPANP